jgi:flagellar basal-body rod protein FlgF
MEDSILVALSLQGVLQRNMAVIANNMANVNTSGFKAEQLMVVDQQVPSERPTVDGRVSTAYVRDIASVRDPTDGRLDVTDNPLDLALRGDGYFVVSTPDGDRYTRAGHFRLDTNGQVVTEEGYTLQGQGGAPMVVAPTDATINVARDGTVSAESGVIGRVRVVQFLDPKALQPLGAGLASSDAQPQDVAAPEMIQGMLERSNVEPINEVERMIRVQRAYDQARSIADREDDRIRKMMVVFVE